MNRLITALLLICVVFINPAWADYKMKQYYVATFVSQEFENMWWGNFYPDLLTVPKHWTDLPKFLDQIAIEAGDKPIIIDLDVHGWDDGLYITTSRNPKRQEGTTVGYVVRQIYEKLGDRNVTVLLEACFSGNAYKYTIRNNKWGPYYNFDQVPPFPIYGAGSGFSNWGNTMYIQTRENVRVSFEDLRTYETKPARAHEVEDERGLSPSCYIMKDFYEFYTKDVAFLGPSAILK